MYQKSQSYDVYFLWSATDIFSMSFWATFCPSILPMTPKITIWKKCLNFYVCTINEDHMLVPKIWSVRQNYCHHFLPFYHFTPLLTQKIKICKKCKKPFIYIYIYIYTGSSTRSEQMLAE